MKKGPGGSATPKPSFSARDALSNRYLSKNRSRQIEFYLHVEPDGTEHRLKRELVGASLRVKRDGNYETTFTRHVYRVSDNQAIPVRPRGLGWSRVNDGYDYDGSALWERLAP